MADAPADFRTIRFDDVADLYDLYVTAEADIGFFVGEATRSGGRILELACGTGRVSLPLLRAGADLTCVDYSVRMLEKLEVKLRAEGRACPLIHADMTELSLGEQFDLIIIPFNSFQEIIDPVKQASALRAIAGHLNEEGTFICTLQNPTDRLKSIDGLKRRIGAFQTDSGGMLTVSSRLSWDPDTKLVHGQQFYEVSGKDHALIERRTLDICFRLFARDEFLHIASSAGLEPLSLYGNYDCGEFNEGTSPFMIWKLKKGR